MTKIWRVCSETCFKFFPRCGCFSLVFTWQRREMLSRIVIENKLILVGIILCFFKEQDILLILHPFWKIITRVLNEGICNIYNIFACCQFFRFVVNTRNCDELPESSQRAPRELPESSQRAPREFPESSQRAPRAPSMTMTTISGALIIQWKRWFGHVDENFDRRLNW